MLSYEVNIYIPCDIGNTFQGTLEMFRERDLFVDLKGRVKKRGNILFTCSLSKGPQQACLGQAEARSEELNPGLPQGWQGPRYLSHYQEVALETEQLWHSNIDEKVASNSFSLCQMCIPPALETPLSFFKIDTFLS